MGRFIGETKAGVCRYWHPDRIGFSSDLTVIENTPSAAQETLDDCAGPCLEKQGMLQ